MANLPAQQAQYVKYAEKDKNGIEIAGLGDVVEMNSARTEMTIGTNLVVDGSIETEDSVTVGNLNVTGTANIGTLEFTSANVEGDLAVNGTITGDEIIENMSGYSATLLTRTNITIENIYTSAVKNGNKLTLVSFVKLNRTDTVPNDNASIVTFSVPASLYPNLIPFTLGSAENLLSAGKVLALEDVDTFIDLYAYTQKSGENIITINLRGVNSLTLNTDYLVRYENTFLLNDSLIS